MKVRMLVSRAGADFSNNVGDVIDVDPEESHRMIDDGQAQPAGPERAVKPARGETAVKDAARKQRKSG